MGFPEARPDGLWVSGQVRSTLSQVGQSPAIQLFLKKPPPVGAPLAGLSGAPVWVDGAVAGLLRWATLDDAGNSVAGSVLRVRLTVCLQHLPSGELAKRSRAVRIQVWFRLQPIKGGCFSGGAAKSTG